ncbi:MAG TPA: hypothetical protein VJ724_13705 [Tahibacter sp.]|nr:hypothetical protein [Tahibacter sp.]
MVEIGDSIKVCNEKQCVVYESRHQQAWNGSPPENVQNGDVGSGNDPTTGIGNNPTNGGITGGTGARGGGSTVCGYVNGVRSRCVGG